MVEHKKHWQKSLEIHGLDMNFLMSAEIYYLNTEIVNLNIFSRMLTVRYPMKIVSMLILQKKKV